MSLKEFTVLDAQGNALRTGQCHPEAFDAQAHNPGERVVEGTHTFEPGVVQESYASQRRRAYPAIADQLDALWKGGTAMQDMRARVLAVKDQFQKPKG